MTIPEMCMEYTKVYSTLKIEVGFAMIAGVLLGILIGKKYDD